MPICILVCSFHGFWNCDFFHFLNIWSDLDIVSPSKRSRYNSLLYWTQQQQLIEYAEDFVPSMRTVSSIIDNEYGIFWFTLEISATLWPTCWLIVVTTCSWWVNLFWMLLVTAATPSFNSSSLMERRDFDCPLYRVFSIISIRPAKRLSSWPWSDIFF